jgi:cyanophycinase-like exopeptidase
MLFVLSCGFPPALMLAVLAMERVERPLNDEKIGEHVARLMVNQAADDVEVLVTRTAAGAVDRHWRRRARLARLARLRSSRVDARS